VAWRLGPNLAAVLVRYLNVSLGLSVILALVLLFLTVAIASALLGKMIQALLRFTHLTLFDRFLGLVTGLIKTSLVLLLFYGGVLFFSPLFPMEWANDSRAMDLASRGWPVVEKVLDRVGLRPTLEELPFPPDRVPLTGDQSS
jgi:uncharacterized membrane protein required for colicin V production